MLSTRQESPAPPPPASDPSPIDYSDDGPGMIAVCSVFLVFATIFVGLRFWSKQLMRAKWTVDDWLILASLIIHHGFTAAGFTETLAGGLGRDIRLVAAENPYSLVILFKVIINGGRYSCVQSFANPELIINRPCLRQSSHTASARP